MPPRPKKTTGTWGVNTTRVVWSASHFLFIEKLFGFSIYLLIDYLDCRNVPDFPKFLGLAMETFLLMCDDPESDVRMVADECLNRTIKVNHCSACLSS